MSIDLTEAEYEELWGAIEKAGGTARFGEYEGSTLSLEGAHLCQSDGQWWLDIEEVRS